MTRLSDSRNTAILYASSLISVVVGVCVSVLNTRNLAPAEYGDVRYVNNIFQFVASLLLFGYFVSGARLLALARDTVSQRRMKGALVAILGVAVAAAMLAAVLCYFAHRLWLDGRVAALFIYCLPICYYPVLQNYVNNVFQGDNSIVGLSVVRALPGILYLGGGIVVYSMTEATPLLMLLLQNGVIVAVAAVAIICTRPSFSRLGEAFRELRQENRHYGLHVYVGSVMAVSLSYLAGITLGIFNDDNVDVGFYTLALTIATPLTLLPSIVGTSYFKRFANEDRIDSKVLRYTLLISVSSYLLFAALITPVVGLLYDESYSAVAGYAVLLAIGTTAHGVGDMFNRFLGAHGLGKQLRNGAVLCGAVLVAGNIILVYFCGVYGAILTRIAASCCYAAAMVYYYRRLRSASK